MSFDPVTILENVKKKIQTEAPNWAFQKCSTETCLAANYYGDLPQDFSSDDEGLWIDFIKDRSLHRDYENLLKGRTANPELMKNAQETWDFIKSANTDGNSILSWEEMGRAVTQKYQQEHPGKAMERDLVDNEMSTWDRRIRADGALHVVPAAKFTAKGGEPSQFLKPEGVALALSVLMVVGVPVWSGLWWTQRLLVRVGQRKLARFNLFARMRDRPPPRVSWPVRGFGNMVAVNLGFFTPRIPLAIAVGVVTYFAALGINQVTNGALVKKLGPILDKWSPF